MNASARDRLSTAGAAAARPAERLVRLTQTSPTAPVFPPWLTARYRAARAALPASRALPAAPGRRSPATAPLSSATPSRGAASSSEQASRFDSPRDRAPGLLLASTLAALGLLALTAAPAFAAPNPAFSTPGAPA